MVTLPTVSNGIVTSSAPTSTITSGVIEQQANQRAGAYGKVADDLMDVSTDLAKKQAAYDLINQKVTRNADGSVNVENPATAPLIFGDAGKAYTDAVKVGTIAQQGNSLSQDFAQLHTQYPTDPAGFKAAADAHLAKTAQSVTGPMGQAVQAEGQQLLTQHFNAITSTAASNDIENQKKSITAQIDDQKNTLIALARQGGAQSPEFVQAQQKLNLSYDALSSNPLFKMPADQIELEKKNTAGLLQGEALVSHVDDTFNKRGKVEAQKALDEGILKNPDLREVDRSRLYTQGLSRLGYLTADAKVNIDANRQITTELESGIAKGTVSPEDPAVGLAVQRARAIGDTEGAQRITAAAAVKQHLRAVDPLPDAIKSEVLGVPGGVVNQAIPAEGRALLNTIASTESAGRYNVRYGGHGDKTFQGFDDHPRVSEPITSGPDVGKTSSAAGRYQFIAPTWDAQAQKLGLKDFSPANQDAAAWDLAQTTYKQKTGKDLLATLQSGQTSDVLPTLSGQWSSLPGGRQPAGRFMSPSANGQGGFTAEQVQQNPFLLSAYVRTLAADPELRVQSAKQTAEAAIKSWDNGILPSPSAFGEVMQAAQLYPDKMGKVADDLQGRLVDAQKILQVPEEQRTQLIEQYKRAADGADVHHQNIANAALDQVNKQNKNMADHPYAEAAQRGWTQTAAPLDPGQPDSVAPALASRATLGARIGGLNHTPPPPILEKDDVPKLQTALQGPQGAQVLGQITQALKPDEMQRLIDGDGFKDSVTAMSRSGDPVKMNAAYSFMDGQQRNNPLQFDREFPDGLKDLRAWQSSLAFYPPEEAAKRLMRQYDPAQAAALETARDTADKALKNVSADQVVSKFSTGWGPIGTGARAPISPDGLASGALKADYDQNYKDGFVATGDPSMADKFAIEKLNNKYAVSPTNGNRVTANPPEKYYPPVAGSHDWMGAQLDDAVRTYTGAVHGARTQLNVNELKQLAGKSPVDASAARKYVAPRALVPDDQTSRDIAAGNPPSYQIVLQDPNGRWAAMTNPDNSKTARFRFDPAQAFAKHADRAEAARSMLPPTDGPPMTPLMSQLGGADNYQRTPANGGGGDYSPYPGFRPSDDIEDRRNRKYSQDPAVEDPNYKREWLSGGEPNSPLAKEAGVTDAHLEGLSKAELLALSEKTLRQMRSQGSDLKLPRRGRPKIGEDE